MTSTPHSQTPKTHTTTTHTTDTTGQEEAKRGKTQERVDTWEKKGRRGMTMKNREERRGLG